jgi:hypothetical protein
MSVFQDNLLEQSNIERSMSFQEPVLVHQVNQEIMRLKVIFKR